MAVSPKIHIVSYSPDYKRGILQLMSGVPYKGLIWHWQYEENPYGLTFEPIVITHSEKVVGFNGAMSVEIIYKGESRQAIWSCDFYVHSDYRGKGLGKTVKDKQFSSNSIIMALGLSEAAAYVWKKKGCNPNEDICILRRYGKVDTVRKSVWALFQAFEYLKGFRSRVSRNACQLIINDSLAKKADVDRLWKKVGGSYKKIVVRNYEYLHWRYEKHPLARYKFIHTMRDGELVAIGVFSKYKNSARFVDMVVHSADIEARDALISGWLELYPDSSVYSCATTDNLIQKCLRTHGFCKIRDKLWHFVHSTVQHDAAPEKGWFLMPGDSDGDFLEAAATEFKHGDRKSGVTVKETNDFMDFKHMREEWAELLCKADANKLFLSWEWQYTWWETWADALGLKLILLKAYHADKLVGIAPLYIDHVRLRSGPKVRRIQFIGNAWGREGTVRTEYLEFIASKSQSPDVCDAFIEYMSEMKHWDEFVICDLQKDSDTYQQIIKHKTRRRWFVDVADKDQGMKIGTIDRFEDYVRGLGPNTRLKLFNRREYLNSRGDVEHVSASKAELDWYLSILNSFHQARWGKDCFTRPSLDFHKTLINRLSGEQNYSLNCIKVDGKPISVLYNLTAGNTVYNIQSGFNQTFNKKLSLGTLHMGYAIEESFSNVRVINFDMLAGRGKTEFYKSKYRGKTVYFVTLRATTSKKLKLLYIIKNNATKRIKHIIQNARRFIERTLTREKNVP